MNEQEATSLPDHRFTTGTPSRSRSRRLRRIAAVAVAAVLAVAVVASVGAADGGGGGYRTAIVGRQDVAETLDLVGTIEPVSQATVSFPVDGTVASVTVAVGDEVSVGRSLAALDPSSLEDALHVAEADLADAALTLERALNGEDVGGSGGSGFEVTPASYSTAEATAVEATPVQVEPVQTASTSTSGADAELRAAQQAVLDAQREADAALAVARTELDQATAICAAVGDDAVDDRADPTNATTSTTSTTAVGSGPAADVEACRTALEDVLAAQATVADAQDAVDAAAAELTELLEREAEAAARDEDASSTDPATGSGAPSAGSGGTASGGSDVASAASSSPTAAELIAYQKKVDAAAAQVTVAEQAVAQGSIVSPIAGTVVSVGMATGDDVTADSDTATIVIEGEGGFEVTTMVAVADLPDVDLGATATVLPDGPVGEIVGEVTAIGVAATEDGTATSYPVTIALTGATADDAAMLGNGATASVSITTAETGDALAVPASAVTTEGDRSTVDVLDGDEVATTAVEVGAVGGEWIEITDGLAAGDEVVLADLDEALPTSATESSGGTATGGAGGGFPGGGGGFPSGGPPGFGG